MALLLLSTGSTAYGMLIFRDLVAFNPVALPIGERGLTFVFVLGTVTTVVVPTILELVTRGQSICDIGFRMPSNWRPALLLVGMGVVLGGAPLAFGWPGPQSIFTLLLALCTPVLKEEFLSRWVRHSC